MTLTISRRLRVRRPAVEVLDSLSLVSILPTLTAVPDWMDALGGGNAD